MTRAPMNAEQQAEWVKAMACIQNEIHCVAHEKGFWDHPREDGTSLALIHSEVSEALEALRAQVPGKNYDSEEARMAHVNEELGDIVIRVLDFAERKGLNVGQAILKKMNINRTRAHKHGKLF